MGEAEDGGGEGGVGGNGGEGGGEGRGDEGEEVGKGVGRHAEEAEPIGGGNGDGESVWGRKRERGDKGFEGEDLGREEVGFVVKEECVCGGGGGGDER